VEPPSRCPVRCTDHLRLDGGRRPAVLSYRRAGMISRRQKSMKPF
jgi:hypothetical protein